MNLIISPTKRGLEERIKETNFEKKKYRSLVKEIMQNMEGMEGLYKKEMR